jgi:hypothetical protein
MSSDNNTFEPGDILELYGETFQCIENLGDKGLVIPFPSENTPSHEVVWNGPEGEYRKMGHAQLPGPTPCSTGDGSCPTDGHIK